MQHGGPKAGKFQHFVAADRVHQLCIGHLARIGAENTRNVGVDLAGIGTQGRRQGDSGGVGAPAPKGGDFVEAITAGAGALETGDHHHLASCEAVADSVGANPEDPGPAMGGFRGDAHLRTSHGCCTDPLGVQGHRQQGDRHLFATGQQHVHLSLGGGRGDGVGQTRQFIGGVAHGGDHHDYVVPLLTATSDPIGHCLDAFHAADGGAPEFLHQEGHGPGFSNAGFSHLAGSDQPSSPSRKASPGWAPRLSRASTSSSRPSKERKRLAGRPCSCLRIT